jgi:hypothetical protein
MRLIRFILVILVITGRASALPDDDLAGMVLCGYQGWFRCEGDGSKNGWYHYQAGGKFEPGHANIDLWPDVSELGPEEKFATPFKHADGRVAEVFSSVNSATVRRHFKWMREYGIDGVFLQRFGVTTLDPRFRKPIDDVLKNCRDSANAEGRKWSLMYDLSGLKPEDFHRVGDDWKQLLADGLIKADDPAYLRVGKQPLLALWGLGFNDRVPGFAEWEELIRFFRNEECSVMVGVPCWWRTMDRDAIKDPKLLEVIALANIVSPWSVGRFGTTEEASARVEPLLKPDIAWCHERGLGYLPVVFPGFSWHNLQKSRGSDEAFDSIPRREGRFIWTQAVAARMAGAKSLYVAMFDEMDEGTAIMKISRDPPVGESSFLSELTTKPDHYLWLTGEIGRFMHGGSAAFPIRK